MSDKQANVLLAALIVALLDAAIVAVVREGSLLTNTVIFAVGVAGLIGLPGVLFLNGTVAWAVTKAFSLDDVRAMVYSEELTAFSIVGSGVLVLEFWQLFAQHGNPVAVLTVSSLGLVLAFATEYACRAVAWLAEPFFVA